MLKQSRYLTAFVLLSIASAIYQSVLYWFDMEASAGLVVLCQSCCVFLLVMWVDADSKGRANIYRPHEFGQLVLLYWLPYLPFYLWRTRHASGLGMLLGFMGLLVLGELAQFVIYLTR